jgi:hypothetical protein
MGSSAGGATDNKSPVEAAWTVFILTVGATVEESSDVDASLEALILLICGTKQKIK